MARMKADPKIDCVDGWVLLTRDEDPLTEQRNGQWHIAWLEVFTRKRAALEFAGKNGWQPPFKAVRASLAALAN